MPDELSAEADARSIEDMLGLDNPAAVIARDPRFNIAPAPPRKGVVERNMPRSFDPSGLQQAQQSVAQGAVTATGFDELQAIAEDAQGGDYGPAIANAVATTAGTIIPFPGAKQAVNAFKGGIRGFHTTPLPVGPSGFTAEHARKGAGVLVGENKQLSGPGGEHWQWYLNNQVDTAGNPVYSNRDKVMAERLYANQFDKDKAIHETQQYIDPIQKELDSNIRHMNIDYPNLKKTLQEEQLMKELYKQGMRPGPSTYDVNIKADPNEFMNLNQQIKDQHILSSIANMIKDKPILGKTFREHYEGRSPTVGTGQQIRDLVAYDAINIPREQKLDQWQTEQANAAAMQLLKSYGIAGTKRVDSISNSNELRRLAGKPHHDKPPTHWYDVTDPKRVEILKKLAIGGGVGVPAVASTMSGFTEQQAAEQ